jgi:hypothetical protein
MAIITTTGPIQYILHNEVQLDETAAFNARFAPAFTFRETLPDGGDHRILGLFSETCK